jgi:hypothetical protein
MTLRKRRRSMHDGDKLEIRIPVPWSAEPIGFIFSGWRCIMFLTVVAALVLLAWLNRPAASSAWMSGMSLWRSNGEVSEGTLDQPR